MEKKEKKFKLSIWKEIGVSLMLSLLLVFNIVYAWYITNDTVKINTINAETDTPTLIDVNYSYFTKLNGEDVSEDDKHDVTGLIIGDKLKYTLSVSIIGEKPISTIDISANGVSCDYPFTVRLKEEDVQKELSLTSSNKRTIPYDTLISTYGYSAEELASYGYTSGNIDCYSASVIYEVDGGELSYTALFIRSDILEIPDDYIFENGENKDNLPDSKKINYWYQTYYVNDRRYDMRDVFFIELEQIVSDDETVNITIPKDDRELLSFSNATDGTLNLYHFDLDEGYTYETLDFIFNIYFDNSKITFVNQDCLSNNALDIKRILVSGA